MTKPLINFTVKAITANGELRNLDISLESEEAVAFALFSQGLTPLSITVRSNTWLDLLNRPIKFNTKPSLSNLAMFIEQLGEMLKAGLTVETALKILTKQNTSKPISDLTQRLLRQISAGSTLSNAMEHEHFLPRFLIGIVRAAEQGGRMSEGLADATRHLRRQIATQRSVVNALSYPAMVFFMIMISLLFILAFVIPEFESIFAGEEYRLPYVTRLVLLLSHLVTLHSFELVLVFIGIPVLIGFSFKKSASFRTYTVNRIQRIPFVHLLIYMDIAQVLGIMGALINNGVDASESMKTAGLAASTQTIGNALKTASTGLREGASVTSVLKRIHFIPETTLSIIEVGEHTGDLGHATVRAAQLLETDSMFKIDRIINLLNPIAISLLGLIVGVVISGVMLGIMSINQLAVR